MKKLNKLSPETYKEIKELAAALPPMAKADKSGNPIYRQLNRVMFGSEILNQQKQRLSTLKAELQCNWFVKQYYIFKAWLKTFKPVKINGELIKPNDKYSQPYSEPVWVNHEVEMVEIYKKHGHQGLVQYLKYVQKQSEDLKILKVKTNNT